MSDDTVRELERRAAASGLARAVSCALLALLVLLAMLTYRVDHWDGSKWVNDVAPVWSIDPFGVRTKPPGDR